MKNLMNYGLFALMAFAVFMTSCTPDDPLDTTTGPSAEITFGAGFENQTFDPGLLLSPLKVRFTAGDADLNAVYVYRNGAKMSIDSFIVDGENKAANPFNLLTDQKDSVTFSFGVILRDAEVTDKYEFLISDVNGETASVVINLTTEVTGTPLQQDTVTYKLWNANGKNPGGLDLDAAPQDATVSSNSPDAEIIDSGIDIGLPDATNWVKKIEPVNGASLMPYSGSFDEITTFEQLVELYNADLEVAQSDEVKVGDVFIVNNGNKYYLLKATVVKEVTTTDSEANNDYYEFAVKKK